MYMCIRQSFPSLPDEYYTCGVQGCKKKAVIFDPYFPYFKSYNCCSDHKISTGLSIK